MKRMGILLLLGLLALNSPAREGLFVVTDASDTTSVHSLRGAVIAANQAGGRNIIKLPGVHGHSNTPKIYYLTIPGPTDDHALTGDLDITTGDLTIVGMGQNVVIDATPLGDRIFTVFGHARLTLINVTLTGGHAPPSETSSVDPNGGAILNLYGTLNLYKCTLTNNSAGDAGLLEGNGPGAAGGDGGAVCTFGGKISMIDCLIEGNSCVSGGNGGGLRSYGTVTLNRCIITGNQSGLGAMGQGLNGFGMPGGNGGGVYNNGLMKIRNCVINGNMCGDGGDGSDPSGLITPFFPGGPGGDGGSGGGIYNAARMEIDACSIYGNHTGRGGTGDSFGVAGNGGDGGSGGGIFNSGTLKLNASTISENTCGAGGNGGDGADIGGSGGFGGGGGGVFNSGVTPLTACTIVLNITGDAGFGGSTFNTNIGVISITRGPAGGGGDGGGIYNLSGTATAGDCLFALNANGAGVLGAGDGSGPDGWGYLSSGGFNLIGIGDPNSGFIGTNSDLVGTADTPIDPLIGPLQMNGGPTPTHALLPGSPAIDQGNNFGIHKDQRGQRRRVDIPAIPNAAGGDGTDIGAFELNAIPTE